MYEDNYIIINVINPALLLKLVILDPKYRQFVTRLNWLRLCRKLRILLKLYLTQMLGDVQLWISSLSSPDESR